MKIVLGTVQFGMTYGINNRDKVSCEEIKNIIAYAKTVGVDTIDTAAVYGDSEQRLGDVGVDSFDVVTKIPKVPENCSNVEDLILEVVGCSLKNLRSKTVYAILLHRPMQLLEKHGEEIWNTLLRLRDDGVTEKIGFSIYSPDEVFKLWHIYKPDLVQAPYNLIDRRIKTSGLLEEMKRYGIEVHARSIFLQGLLLKNRDNIPAKFNKWEYIWSNLDDWRKERNMSALESCLSFALNEKELDKIVIGIHDLEQLKKIVDSLSCITKVPPLFPEVIDLDLIEPSRW